MGKLIHKYDGTIDHRAGDGIIIIFNDPLPCDEAGDGEIMLSNRACAALEDRVQVGAMVELTLKGFHEPVEVFRVAATREDAS